MAELGAAGRIFALVFKLGPHLILDAGRPERIFIVEHWVLTCFKAWQPDVIKDVL
jgi:hypothetical protein